MIPVTKRRGSFAEVEMAWSRTVALAETKRCLRCDYRETATNPLSTSATNPLSTSATAQKGA
jgi:hypothetical protein